MTDAPRDPYRVLGVAPTATDAEITGAYRRLVRHLHPDADNNADPNELEEVLAAYQLLRDPARRAAYDREHGRDNSTRGQRTNQASARTTMKPRRTSRDTQVTDVPVRHHQQRQPDVRVGPVRRHR
ncbi:J domain-containing protein [Haloechinothrix halophila]|uniref:DnaJ-class molecular chaperone with C-terminal Zn finger domain n=1 Tax=Haloechinothrix halophila YIM 93223 TaxID=592678 RepID=W9DNM4_9PSEU|nr:J domain-containing protein [Haloechinothrix halophila]ETA66578.1 DnaJ-class molecular chaperone with C-terminal Zn finger domain [Haloechinothrix halophila YIM 93223]